GLHGFEVAGIGDDGGVLPQRFQVVHGRELTRPIGLAQARPGCGRWGGSGATPVRDTLRLPVKTLKPVVIVNPRSGGGLSDRRWAARVASMHHRWRALD